MTDRRYAKAQKLRKEFQETDIAGHEEFGFSLAVQRAVRLRTGFDFPLRLLRAFAPLR
jgi:hypothetical protein